MKSGPAYADMYEFKIFFDSSESKLKEDNNTILLCKEINWPSKTLNLSNSTGVNLGENEKRYPYALSSNELEATFTLDKNLVVLQFFYRWMEGICPASQTSIERPLRRFNYPENYYATVVISKLERDHEGAIQTGYIRLTECYPYAQDIIPMAYDKTRPMELTMRFTFTETYEFFEYKTY